MSVIMPKFLEPENRKWVEEVPDKDGFITYKAKKDAPLEIKKSIKEWNNMFKRAEKEGRCL